MACSLRKCGNLPLVESVQLPGYYPLDFLPVCICAGHILQLYLCSGHLVSECRCRSLPPSATSATHLGRHCVSRVAGMHVGALLRLPLLLLLLDDSPTTPGTRILGYPILPPCGTRDPFGRALGYPIHSGAEAPSGAGVPFGRALGYPIHPGAEDPSLGARASHGRALGDPIHPGAGRPQRSTPGMTVGLGDPIARGSQGCCCSLGGSVDRGYPFTRDSQGALSSSGGTVVGGDPFPRDPRRSLVELRDFVHSAILPMLCLRFPANILLILFVAIAPMLN